VILFESLGHGGGIIKRESIIAVLLILSIALPLSADTAFATNTTSTNSSLVKTNTTHAVTATTTSTNLTTAAKTTTQAAGSPTTTTQPSFTRSQINTAAASVTNFVGINHRLPSYVTISSYQVTMPQFLKLITANLLNINKGLNTPVTLKTVTSPSNTTETVKNGNILESEYLTLAQTIQTTISSTGKAPSYVNSSLGKIKFDNLVYTYSKILNFQNTNQRLPTYVSVKPWTIITASNVTEGNINLRPVYIVSDNINNLQTDTARVNALISALTKLGIKAYSEGIGPQTHLNVLSNSNVPKNALIVEIAGGADAGCLLEKGSTWYKNLLGTRKDFIALTAGATKITGLAWLPRSHDDNYDPASFTGIAHPDQYLLKNGYHYFEGLTNTNMAQLAQSIYSVAAS
jgi:hypothetical protein